MPKPQPKTSSPVDVKRSTVERASFKPGGLDAPVDTGTPAGVRPTTQDADAHLGLTMHC